MDSAEMQAPTSQPLPDPSLAEAASPDGARLPTERLRRAVRLVRLLIVGLILLLLTRFFMIVPAGERGVKLQFGAVQPRVLEEGLHPLLPLVHHIKLISVRVQSLAMETEAASKDLQDVAAEVALNWHVLPDQVNSLFQQLGDLERISAAVIRPAIEDSIKAVLASFTAEQLITERSRVKSAITSILEARLSRYNLVLDDIDLLQVDFSERFREAVEAKQIAEQEAKRAEYEAIRAQKLAEAKVFLARGQAQAQELLQASLTPQILEHETIEKWNGHLPLVTGNSSVGRLDLKSFIKADKSR